MSSTTPATLSEIDDRFKPTVIHVLKNGQIYVSNGCGQWHRFETLELAMLAVSTILNFKMDLQRQLNQEKNR